MRQATAGSLQVRLCRIDRPARCDPGATAASHRAILCVSDGTRVPASQRRRRNGVSVIVGISADSDFEFQNAGYRVLTEIAFSRTDCREDRRILEAGGWVHLLDLTTLAHDQARRIAWLLDEAVRIRIQAWRDDGTEAALAGAAYYGSFLEQLRRVYGEPPETVSHPTEPALNA
jgi:hypothetical protein